LDRVIALQTKRSDSFPVVSGSAETSQSIHAARAFAPTERCVGLQRVKAWRQILVAAGVALAASLACAEVRVRLVVGVSDGDTLTARCGEPGAYQQIKVLLSGIDAPEKRQAFAERARQALATLTFKRWARLDCRKTDRYGRSVCSLWVASASAPDGPLTLDEGPAMLTVGMAWWYRAYASEQTPEARGQYEFAEIQAKAKGVGLWRDAHATAPWDWRRLQRASPRPSSAHDDQNPGCGFVSGGVGSGIAGACPGSDGCGWSTRLGGGSRAGLGCGTFGCCSPEAVGFSSMVFSVG
jgi:endonuclease YncB( thermonuclease family)